MGFLTGIQRYPGLGPVRVLDGYDRAGRDAFLACRRCGAFVSAEGQDLHKEWHRAAGA